MDRKIAVYLVNNHLSHLLTLTVLFVFIFSVEPIMHNPPINKTVNQGVVVYFTCEANGIPSPTLQWEFNNGPLPAWASVSSNGEVLTISSTTQQTMGKYTCIAQNNQGAVRADAYLRVKGE